MNSKKLNEVIIKVEQVFVIGASLYWILIGLSIITLGIDWGIKIKNNDDGSEGKERINKTFRGKLFGVFILIAIGIILTSVFGVLI